MATQNVEISPRDVAVVIPALNEERHIGGLLDSLLGQRITPARIVVVDAGSTDDTVDEIQRRARQAQAVGCELAIVSKPGAYPGTARNAGIESCSHSWIALIDAGVIPDAAWLEHLVDAAARDTVAVIFGSYEPILQDRFAEAAAIAYVPVRSSIGGRLIRGPSTASCLLTRAAWHRAGGFPPYRASEDLAFFDVICGTERVAAAPTAVVRWHIVANWRQCFQRFSLYSYHNLVAGRGYDWHHGILRMYVVGFVLLVLAFWWPWLLAAIPLGLAARALKSAWRKRDEFGLSHPLAPDRLAVVMLVLLCIDAATFAGWFRFLKRARSAIPVTA